MLKKEPGAGREKKKKHILPAVVLTLLLAAVCSLYAESLVRTAALSPPVSKVELLMRAAEGLFFGEPREVRELREREVVQTDEGHQEYYFQLLNEDERRCYREILEGVRNRAEEFYVTMAADERVDRVYHAVLKDHPELFWIHNREQVYKTTFSDSGYCMFSPGYTYSAEESAQIQASMEAAYQAVLSTIPQGADTYEKVKAVYTYLIDHVEYRTSEHDQNIAGVFWKNAAVCAGYAGAVQYLLERMDIPCIYVEGSARGSAEGHAWNIVTIDGENYYVDVTNGDQPQFLIGDAAQLPEHKTTMYDYLCPFPQEYELDYTASEEFEVPECTALDKNFYVLNQGCFDSYSWVRHEVA